MPVVPRRALIAAAVAGLLVAGFAAGPLFLARAQESGGDGAGEAAPPEEPPTAVIDRLHDALLGVMREADTLGFEGRFERLRPVLAAVFDFESMARFTIGRANFEALGAEEQARLVDRFAAMSTANYARGFDGYSGQSFVTEGASDGPRGVTIVRSRLERPADDAVRLNYVLRPIDGQWRVIDVLLDGSISELARRRSEISSIYAAQGYDGVIESLEEAAGG
ncbi:MAG: ABC transporter substrate-binding protein [Azospirillaceae bacterium]